MGKRASSINMLNKNLTKKGGDIGGEIGEKINKENKK